MNFSKDVHLPESFSLPLHLFPLTNHEQGYKVIKEETSCQHATKTQIFGCVSFTGDVRKLMYLLYIRHFTVLLTFQSVWHILSVWFCNKTPPTFIFFKKPTSTTLNNTPCYRLYLKSNYLCSQLALIWAACLFFY